jgi:hypothetical protein
MAAGNELRYGYKRMNGDFNEKQRDFAVFDGRGAMPPRWGLMSIGDDGL